MSDSKPSKKEVKPRLRFSEKQRTVVLVFLITFAVIYIYWIQSGIDENFVETL